MEYLTWFSDSNIISALNYMNAHYLPVIYNNYLASLAGVVSAYVLTTLYIFRLRRIIYRQMKSSHIEDLGISRGSSRGWCTIREYTGSSYRPHWKGYSVGMSKMHVLLGSFGMWLYGGDDLEGNADVPATRWTMRLLLLGLFIFLLMSATASYLKMYTHSGDYTYINTVCIMSMYCATIASMIVNSLMCSRPVTIYWSK